MASKILLSLVLLAAASPAALAVFDVPKILAEKAQYSTFLKLLMQTKVVEAINQLKSVSLLVLPDKAIQPVASLPADKQRLVVANHVLLKYFDPIQLDELEHPTAMLATLLSNTDKHLGVLNYTKAHDGQMYFAAPGAPTAAKLVKVVAARPYALSIMEVNKPIFPPGIGPAAANSAIGGRRPNGGKGKIKMSSAESEKPRKATTPAGEAAAKTSSAGAATPSAAPKL